MREVEEEPGMHQHAVALEQLEHEILLAARRRHTQDGRPARIGREHLNRGMLAASRLQGRIVRADALEDAAREPAPAAMSDGAAACTGVETDK